MKEVLLKNTRLKRLSKVLWEKKESFQMCTSCSSFMKEFSSIVKWSFKCCIICASFSVCMFYESMFLAKSFLPVYMFREFLERIISVKGVGVHYKPFLVFIESHYVFRSEFESVYIQSLLSTCFCAWMLASREVWSLRA